MEVEIPDKLKADVPQTTWGKVLMGTPVVMAVVATMLAGLSSSEMTSAQYDRSLGAQQQSKAGDQWSFFQAKRLRGAFQQNTFEILENITDAHPLNATALRNAIEQLRTPAGAAEARLAEAASIKSKLMALLDSPNGVKALAMFAGGNLPEPPPAIAPDAEVKAALDVVNSTKSEAEIAPVIARVKDGALDEALRNAKDRAAAFDDVTKPINDAISHLQDLLARQVAGVKAFPELAPSESYLKEISALNRDFIAATMRYAALRYDVEARLNQAIASLYEVQVRRSNFTAERHHKRSENFFYGMLGAQLGVIISTFALAARQRSVLWVIAATAGLIAVAFAVYVYLYV